MASLAPTSYNEPIPIKSTNDSSSSELTFSDVETHRKLSISKALLSDFPQKGESRHFYYLESAAGALENVGVKGGNTVTSFCDLVQDTVCDENGILKYTSESVRKVPFEIITMMVEAMVSASNAKVDEAKNT